MRLNAKEVRNHCNRCRTCVFDEERDYPDRTFSRMECPWLAHDDSDAMGWPKIPDLNKAGFNVCLDGYLLTLLYFCILLQPEMRAAFEETFDKYHEGVKKELWERAPSLATCIGHILRKRSRQEQEQDHENKEQDTEMNENALVEADDNDNENDHDDDHNDDDDDDADDDGDEADADNDDESTGGGTPDDQHAPAQSALKMRQPARKKRRVMLRC